MADEEDFLLRPVLRGMCKFESLKDGTLDLFDVALMNEAIDVEDHNQLLLNNHLKREAESGRP